MRINTKSILTASEYLKLAPTEKGHAKVFCAHCGSVCSFENKTCTGCGSPVKSIVYTEQHQIAHSTPQRKFLGFFVWLLLGLFGGYAYWSGDKIKAYTRALMWIGMVVCVVSGSKSTEAGTHFLDDLFYGLFAILIILIFIFWLFDLARFLKRNFGN